jgi:CBS domain-containing protein
MKVSEAMNREVVTISPNANLVKAAALMRARNVGVLPVIEDDKVVGVLTDRDIVIRSIYEDLSPVSTRVSEAMTESSVWCYEEDVLADAAKILADHHIHRLLVFDRDRKLVGLLSVDDLATKMSSDRLLGSLLRQITAAAA